MNILWIEDFERGTPDSIAINIFKDAIPTLEGKLNENDNIDIPFPERFASSLSDEKVFRIDICLSYEQWAKEYKQKYSNYDLFIIDVNLAKYRSSDEIQKENKHYGDDEAGVKICMDLIQKNYPVSNVAFLTGQDETIIYHKTQFKKQSSIFPENIFSKSTEGFQKIREWISSIIRNPYFILRRGVLEGQNLIRDNLKRIGNNQNDLDDFILVFKTFKSGKIPLAKDKVSERKEYLEKVINFWNLNSFYSSEINYHSILKNITEDLDSSEIKLINILTPNYENIFKNACIVVMTILRNTSAHGNLPELNETEMAFFFLIFIRAFFDLPIDKVYRHEHILAKLFESNSEAKLEKDKISIELFNKLKSLKQYVKSKGYSCDAQDYSEIVSRATYLEKSKLSKEIIREIILNQKVFYRIFFTEFLPFKEVKSKEDFDSVPNQMVITKYYECSNSINATSEILKDAPKFYASIFYKNAFEL